MKLYYSDTQPIPDRLLSRSEVIEYDGMYKVYTQLGGIYSSKGYKVENRILYYHHWRGQWRKSTLSFHNFKFEWIEPL